VTVLEKKGGPFVKNFLSSLFLTLVLGAGVGAQQVYET
jgi:hypothetical protein